MKVQALNSDHAAVVAEAREAQEKIVEQLQESYKQKEAEMKDEFEVKAGEIERTRVLRCKGKRTRCKST